MGQSIIFSGDDNEFAANVKPPSTAPVAADPALVVAISPNSTITATDTPTATAPGTTDSRVHSAAGTNATSLKASPGNLYGFLLANRSTKERYLKFYDKASAPVPGTDTPKFTIFLPPKGEATVFRPRFAIFFTLGIAYAITGAVADSDTTAIALDDVHGEITWF